MSNKRLLLLTTPQTYRAAAFVKAAARLGIEVVQAIDIPPELVRAWNAPLGLDFADLEAATAAIVAFAREQPLAAIMAVDDSGALLAARASAALGLRHNSPEAALAARDKGRMRHLLHLGGVRSPDCRLCSFEEDIEALAGQVSYPCVVKPLALSGSRGVMRADDPQTFQAAVARLARIVGRQPPEGQPQGLPLQDDGRGDPRGRPVGVGEFLVEQFIPGVEVALEGLLEDGQLRVLTLFDKPDPLDGPFFEETIYVTPSRLPLEAQAAIIAMTARAARALGLTTGPIHAELRLNEAGAWVIEVAGRSIGGLCSQVLRFGVERFTKSFPADEANDLANRFTLEELLLRQAFGLDIASLEREDGARGVMMIPIPRAGLLRGVRGVAEAEAVDGVEEVTITAKLNYELTPLPEGESYLGFIFACAETPAAAEAALRAAHQRLEFQIEPVIRLAVGQRR